jgi:lysophospholipase L1-like esterase
VKKQNKKKIFFYLFTLILIVVFVLFVSEGFLRIFGFGSAQGLHTASDPIFNRIPGIFEPNQHFLYKDNPKIPFKVFINSLGFRGPEITLKKASKTIRILCLGDSNTFGYVVDDDETYPYRLQSLFVQEDKMVEVINGGVGGTTIVDQFYFLKKSIKIEPDIVILTFFINDINDLNRHEPLYISIEKNRKLKSSYAFRAVFKIIRDTALFQIFLRFKSKIKIILDLETPPQKNRNFYNLGKYDEIILRKKYADYLREMDKYLKNKSVKFMFIILPSHHQIGEKTEFSDLHNMRVIWAEKLANEIGIPSVNILNSFKEIDAKKNVVFLIPDDGHPSADAYSIVANKIYDDLRKNFKSTFF